MDTEDNKLQSLTISRVFQAPREEVFRAWTDPRALSQWMMPGPDFTMPIVEVDLRQGGDFRFVMRAPSGDLHIGYGTYRQIEPPLKLVFTWNWEQSNVQPAESVVTVEFQDRGDATEIVLRHDKLSGEESKDAHAYGWTGCLDSLTAFLESHK